MQRLMNVAKSIVLTFCFTKTLVAAEFKVFGYSPNKFNGKWTLNDLGQDPLLGRATCPALARLNLATRKIEPVLAQDIHDPSGKGTELRVVLRLGLKWWDGAQVEIGHVEEVLKKQLSAKGIEASIKKPDGLGRSLILESKDRGLFLALTEPLVFEPKAGESVCAGIFAVTKTSDHSEVSLIPSKGYRSESVGHKISFFPYSEFPSQCLVEFEVPVFVGIYWTPFAQKTLPVEFRRGLLHSIPRGEIQRTILSRSHSLTLGPVLRSHPSNVASQKIPGYNLPLANQLLRLKEADKSTASNQTKKLMEKINIQAPEGRYFGFLTKLVSDSFATVGVHSTFQKIDKVTLTESAHGVLSEFQMNWPISSLEEMFEVHSAERLSLLEDKTIKRQHDQYIDLLERGKFKPELLSSALSMINDQDVFLPLFSRNACILTSGKLKGGRAKINVNDPDWFKDLIQD